MSRNADLRKCGQFIMDAENAITRHVLSLDDKRAESLRRAMRRLTETNCWWAEYRAARVIKVALGNRRLLKPRKRSKP